MVRPKKPRGDTYKPYFDKDNLGDNPPTPVPESTLRSIRAQSADNSSGNLEPHEVEGNVEDMRSCSTGHLSAYAETAIDDHSQTSRELDGTDDDNEQDGFTYHQSAVTAWDCNRSTTLATTPPPVGGNLHHLDAPFNENVDTTPMPSPFSSFSVEEDGEEMREVLNVLSQASEDSSPILPSLSSLSAEREVEPPVYYQLDTSEGNDNVPEIPEFYNFEGNDISDNSESENDEPPVQQQSSSPPPSQQEEDETSEDNTAHEHEPPAVIQPYSKLSSLLEGEYSRPITTPVNATPGEVLRNALALCKQHNWGHSEKEDLMKFVNSLFSSKVVPDTRYLLDQLFFCAKGLHYYFYCTKCTMLLGEVDITDKSLKYITCTNDDCQFDNYVSNLLESSYFVTIDVPHQLEAILANDSIRKKLVSPLDFRGARETISDVYDGECYRSFVSKLDPNSNFKYISFSISLDGAALFTSSRCSIWPCFLTLHEIPPVFRSQNLITCGLWFGTKKAKMDLFMEPITDHFRALADPGFKIKVGTEEWRMKAYIIACCADSGARCDIQGIHSHRGEYPCSWCLHKGIELDKARKFPFIYPFSNSRTHNGMLQDATEALRTKTVVNGVKCFPVLAACPMFDNVNSFITEWLHVGAEGIAKAFTLAWTGKKGKEEPYCFIKSTEVIEEINKRISTVKPPVEVRKYLRSLGDLKHWTGREWENWLLYFSVPILNDILSNRYLKHWILLVQASHLLLRTSISTDMLNVANLLLIEFVGEVEQFYGLQMMTYNVHLLLHLVLNVKNWGPLWSISGFTFEFGNQIIKKMVLANNGIPNQICRSLSEDNALNLLHNTASCSTLRANQFCEGLCRRRHSKVLEVGKVQLYGCGKLFNPNNEEKWICERLEIDHSQCLRFEKVQVEGVIYAVEKNNINATRSCKTNNSFAYLKDNCMVKIRGFLYNEVSQDIFVIFSRVRSSPYMTPPRAVSLDSICYFLHKVNSVDADIAIEPLSSLSGIFVTVSVSHNIFLTPIANVLNMW